jgi:predicted DNA-binding transcriptional regulator AlpA
MAEEKIEKTNKEYLTLNETIDMLGLSRTTVHTLMTKDKTFPVPFNLSMSDSKMGRKNYRFNKEELREWLQAKRAK